MIQFTKQELTDLYWLITQYQAECDPYKYRDYHSVALINKIGKMWDEANEDDQKRD